MGTSLTHLFQYYLTSINFLVEKADLGFSRQETLRGGLSLPAFVQQIWSPLKGSKTGHPKSDQSEKGWLASMI